jgi:hypothetical protein
VPFRFGVCYGLMLRPLTKADRPTHAMRLHASSNRKKRLLGFVLFEELPGFFEGEGVSVDDQLVYAGVFRDGDDALDTMAVLAQGLDDEVDVYHA